MLQMALHEVDIIPHLLFLYVLWFFFFFQAEDGIRDDLVTGVQTCALPIYRAQARHRSDPLWPDHDAEPDDRLAASAARHGAVRPCPRGKTLGRAHDGGDPADRKSVV